MELFNPKQLIPGKSTILGELFENNNLKIPLTLFWTISIPLQDFKIGNFTIYEPEIQIGSFTLPYVSKGPKFDSTKKILRSWKELPNSAFDLSNSLIDNIGSIYYNIKRKELGDDWKDDVIDTEATEFFDNIIEVQQIKFGEINHNRINTKLTMQINFDGFNMQEPPFWKELQCDIFEIEAELEIKEVKLLDTSIRVNNVLEAIKISEKALQINDYDINSKNEQFFVSLSEKKERMIFIFEPKFKVE